MQTLVSGADRGLSRFRDERMVARRKKQLQEARYSKEGGSSSFHRFGDSADPIHVHVMTGLLPSQVSKRTLPPRICHVRNAIFLPWCDGTEA